MYIPISQLGIVDDSSDVEEAESEPSPFKDPLMYSLAPQWITNMKTRVILRLSEPF